MAGSKVQYIVDKSGKRLAIVLDIKRWNKILEQLEDLEDIRALDKIRKYPQKMIPLEQAVAEIEKKRKKKPDQGHKTEQQTMHR